ncbi:MAG: TRAP transporter small permease subunit [Elusimicrobia bacterium]|nr:TRAP transporter small permease subunit [Elusimicrobiota bacterium]
MRSLKKAEELLVRAERVALTALLAFMVALAFLQVVLRQVGLHTGVQLSVLWGDTLLRNLVLWVGFLGAAIAAASDKQFAMDAASQILKGRPKAAAATICNVFAAIVSGWLAKAAWAFLVEERTHGGKAFTAFGADIPGWWFEAAAPAGFLLLAIHYALRTADTGRQLATGHIEENTP